MYQDVYQQRVRTLRRWTIAFWLVNAFLALVAVAASGQSPFETRIDVANTSAITAKAASIEQLADRVAIFTTDEDTQRKPALRIAVKSTAKFVVVRATVLGNGRPVPVQRFASGDWIMFGSPATYVITVIESDPEKGIYFTDVESTILDPGKPPTGPPTDPPPNDPPPTDPPADDNAELTEVARIAAEHINDRPTAIALAAAYRSACEQIDLNGPVHAAKALVVAKRRAALLYREKFDTDWSPFLNAVEPLLLARDDTVAQYRSAILALATGLDPTPARESALLSPITIDDLGLAPLVDVQSLETGPNAPRIVTWDLGTQYANGTYNGTFNFGDIEYNLNVFGRYWNVQYVRVSRGGQYHVIQANQNKNPTWAAWTNGVNTYINPQFNFGRNKALCGMVTCHERCHVGGRGHHAQDGGLMGPNGGYNLNPNDWPYMSGNAWKSTLRPTHEPNFVKQYWSQTGTSGLDEHDETLFPLLPGCQCLEPSRN